MIRPWIGSRRIAFIPVWNRRIDAPPPEDWIEQVRARVFYDPDDITGIDRSLQRYVQSASSGIAYIEGEIFPVVEAEDDDTVGAGLASLPVSHNYDYAVIILPHSVGQHRGGFAWFDGPATNGISNFARVAMFADPNLTDRKTLGVWMMEVLHITTSFGDLYFTNPMLGSFDVMACSCGTHPSAHTKFQIGWLHSNAIRTHALGTSRTHILHAISLLQPAPFWRTSAIRVPSRTTNGHFLIEARLRNDVYESNSAVSSGIPNEGVIVYEVQGTTELYLRTPSALNVGDVFEDADEKLKVRVSAAELGGFSVNINAGSVQRCQELANQIDALAQSLELENDSFARKQILSALQRARGDFRRLGCLLIHDPATEVFASRFFGPKAGNPSQAEYYDPD
jgi:hypothetical protein